MTTVHIGTACDGLPLVLSVERRTSVENAVLGALGWPPKERLAPAIAEALARLEAAVGGITTLEGRRVYRTVQMIGTVLGQTLLERALGARSPLLLDELPFPPITRVPPPSVPPRPPFPAPVSALPPASESSPATVLTGPPTGAPRQPPVPITAAAAADRPGTVLNVLAGHRRIAVPLDESEPFVVSEAPSDTATPPPAEPPSEPSAPSVRPLVFEDLRTLAEVRYHVSRADGELDEGSLTDASAYTAAMSRAQGVAWSVSRRDVALALAQLARALDAMHADGKVHADVKPANALLTAEGAMPIDEIGVTVGEVSPAATPGWAAPEQVLARPVGPATDVYALGIMVAALVGGAVYGEERTFIIATGGRKRQRVKVLAGSGVYIDPRTVELEDAPRRAWQEFIVRSIAFDADERLAGAADFAAEIERLIETHGLPGRLPVRGGPGLLLRNVEIQGEVQPAWVVSDRW